MTELDRERFNAEFVRLCAAFNRDPKAAIDQAAAWFEYLADLPLASVLDAMRASVKESGRFFPTVGLVAELAKVTRGAGRGQQAHSGPTRSCPRCDGTGFVPVVDGKPEATWTEVRNPYLPLKHSGVRHCDCKRDRRAA